MKMRNFALLRSLRYPLLISAVSLLLSFNNVFSLLSSAFAEQRGDKLEKLFFTRGATYFVAANGNDQGPGTADRPWATINHAAEQLTAGDTVVIRDGHYVLPAQVRVRHSGRPGAWITFTGYPGDEAVLDAQLIRRASIVQGVLDNGAFQIQGVSYIRVVNLTLINSHDAGFAIRDGANIDLINNTTNGTFSSGIAVWDSNHDGKGARQIRILGNTIIKATTLVLAPPNLPKGAPAPHEALTISGAVGFEVAYNRVYDSDKEGIDVKDTSKQGRVHHNLVYNVERQGVYVDGWNGKLSDVEIFSNVIHDCHGAGLVLSVENGESDENIKIHNNLIFHNDGSGLYFARWGVDNPRRNIQIFHNVFYRNGYGPAKAGQTYYWLTGGLYLHSRNVHGVSIKNNIFSDNRGFQIGYSDLFVRDNRSWQAVAREKQIQIATNLIDGPNAIDSPIESGGDLPDRVHIYAVNGDRAIFGNALLMDPANQDFTVRAGSPAALGHVAEVYTPGAPSLLWWKEDFPPKIAHIYFNRSD